MIKETIGPFLWRGALSGALGMLVLPLYEALSYKYTLGYVPYSHLYIIGIPMWFTVGGILGAVVGLVIWTCYAVTGRIPGGIVRAAIGMGFVTIIGLLMHLMSKQGNYGLVTPSLAYRVSISILAVLAVGALPGITAHYPKQLREIPAGK